MNNNKLRCDLCGNEDTTKMYALAVEKKRFKIDDLGIPTNPIVSPEASTTELRCERCFGLVKRVSTTVKFAYTITASISDMYVGVVVAESEEEALRLAAECDVENEWEPCGDQFVVNKHSFEVTLKEKA